VHRPTGQGSHLHGAGSLSSHHSSPDCERRRQRHEGSGNDVWERKRRCVRYGAIAVFRQAARRPLPIRTQVALQFGSTLRRAVKCAAPVHGIPRIEARSAQAMRGLRGGVGTDPGQLLEHPADPRATCSVACGRATKPAGSLALRRDVVKLPTVDDFNVAAITEGDHALACEGPK
jgi:hypothetical protein